MAFRRRGAVGHARRGGLLSATLVAMLVAACAGGSQSAGVSSARVVRGPSASRSVQPGLIRQRSGLLTDHAFAHVESQQALLKEFEVGGSAPASKAFTSVRADGLRVGVHGAPGAWQGYFAVTRSFYPAGSVIHVRMFRQPSATLSASQTAESVFAVQTGTTKKTGAINYVLVASVQHGPLAHWEVGYAEGHVANAKTTILWASRPASSTATPLVEDITLRTDGHDSLTVYFGSRPRYTSDRLHMNIVAPFQAYLEAQALEVACQARFQQLWVTSADTVTVQGLRPGARVSLTSNQAFTTRAIADQTGEAQLTLPLPDARGSGVLVVEQSGTTRRFAGIEYSGGDVYRLSR